MCGPVKTVGRKAIDADGHKRARRATIRANARGYAVVPARAAGGTGISRTILAIDPPAARIGADLVGAAVGKVGGE